MFQEMNCVICNKSTPATVNITEKGLITLVSTSYEKGDDVHKRVNDSKETRIHIICRKDYTRKSTVAATLKAKELEEENEGSRPMENKRLSREMRRLSFGQAGRKAAVQENIDATEEVSDNDNSDSASQSEDEISKLREKIGDYSKVAEGGIKQREKWWTQEAVKEVLEKCENNIITKRKASEMLGVPYNYVVKRIHKVEKENEINPKKFKSADDNHHSTHKEITINHSALKALSDEEAAQLMCMSLYNFVSKTSWENISKKDPATKMLILSQIGEYTEVYKSENQEEINIWWNQPLVRKIIELYRRKIISDDIATELGVPIMLHEKENLQENINKDKQQPTLIDILARKNFPNNSLLASSTNSVILSCENDVTVKNQEHVVHIDKIRQIAGKENDDDDEEEEMSDEDDGSEWEVEKILSHRKNKSKFEYLVKWDGYSVEKASWEPKENLVSCLQMVNDYHIQLQCTPRNSTNTESASIKSSKVQLNCNKEKITKVSDERIHKGVTEYLVQWKKSASRFAPSWEPMSSIPGFQESLNEYQQQKISNKIQFQIRKEAKYYSNKRLSNDTSSSAYCFTNWLVKNNEGDYICKYCCVKNLPLGYLHSSFTKTLNDKFHSNSIFLLQHHAIDKSHLQLVRKEEKALAEKNIMTGNMQPINGDILTSLLTINQDTNERISGANIEKDANKNTLPENEIPDKISGFMLWLAKFHEHLPKRSPNTLFKLRGLELLEWEKASEDKRQTYHDLASDINAIIQQLKQDKVQNNGLLTGYVLYSAATRKEVLLENPSVNGVRLSVLAYNKWTNLNKKVQDEYQDRALQINLINLQSILHSQGLIQGMDLNTAVYSEIRSSKEANNIHPAVMKKNGERLGNKEAGPTDDNSREDSQRVDGNENKVHPTKATPSIYASPGGLLQGVGGDLEDIVTLASLLTSPINKNTSRNSFSNGISSPPANESPILKERLKFSCMQVETILAHEGGASPGSYLVRFCRIGKEVKHGWIKAEKMIVDQHNRDLLRKYWEKKLMGDNADDVSKEGNPSAAILQSLKDLNENKSNKIVLEEKTDSPKPNSVTTDSPKQRSASLLVENCNEGIKVPEGWTRIVRMRTGGKGVGKCDVTYTSPTGKRLRSTIDVHRYCMENGLDVHPALLHFSHSMSAKGVSAVTEEMEDLPSIGEAAVGTPKASPSRTSGDISKTPRRDSVSSSSGSPLLMSSSPLFKTKSKQTLKVETVLAHEGGSETPGSYLVRFCRIGQEVKHGWIKATKMNAEQHTRDLLSKYWDKKKTNETAVATSSSKEKNKSSDSTENG